MLGQHQPSGRGQKRPGDGGMHPRQSFAGRVPRQTHGQSAHAGDPRLGDEVLEERDLLLRGVHQDHLDVGARDADGDPGKAAATAGIEERPFGDQRGKGERIEQVLLHHLAGIGDGGQVHRLVPLEEHVDVPGEEGALLGMQTQPDGCGAFLE